MNDGPRPSPTVDVHDQRAGEAVEGGDRVDVVASDLGRWGDVAARALEGERVTHGHLDLLFVTEQAMAELNAQHMGHDGPTDVLSFPLDGPEAMAEVGSGATAIEAVPPPHLGDLVVCPAVAQRQAPSHCGSIEAELTLLIVHGVLHILGHDHAVPGEALTMQAREREHLLGYGYRHPVPAR